MLPSYRVEVSDPADAEAEAAAQRLALLVSAEYAARWYTGLLQAFQTLAVFPRQHAVADENDLYSVEVRRMLYYGPGGRRRRGGTVYRILFHIIEPAEEEDEGERVVRILHVYHGAQRSRNERG